MKKIPDVNGLLTATVFNAIFDELENKMSDTSGISKLVKKHKSVYLVKDSDLNAKLVTFATKAELKA